MSTGRGERFIAQQLADMAAAGLGGPGAVDPAEARRAMAKAARGPQWREWWRVAVGAVLLIGGVGLWVGAHLITVPQPTLGGGVLGGVVDQVRTSDARLLLEIVGIVTAVAGIVWLLNQVWPRRRTYDTRDVTRAGITAGLLVASVGLWFAVGVNDGLRASSFLIVVVAGMQTSSITRTTGPDSARQPVNDARAAAYQAITPWPVVLGVSVVYCVAQVVALLR